MYSVAYEYSKHNYLSKCCNKLDKVFLLNTNTSEIIETKRKINLSNFNICKMLTNLKINIVKFNESYNNHCLGYATENNIAIISNVKSYQRVLFHEVAHVILGHTNSKYHPLEDRFYSDLLKPNEREVEAELVSLLVLQSLDIKKGIVKCSKYIDHHQYGKNELSLKVVNRVLDAVNKILDAGESYE